MTLAMTAIHVVTITGTTVGIGEEGTTGPTEEIATMTGEAIAIVTEDVEGTFEAVEAMAEEGIDWRRCLC